MSYILDALRRADLERERGTVPGLNAQPAPLPTFGPATPRSARPWVWALIGVLVLLLAALAWYAFGRSPLQSPASAAASAAEPVRPPTMPAPITAPAPATAQADSAASPASAAVTRTTAPTPTPPAPAVARSPAADSSTAAPPPSRHASPKASRTAPKVDGKAASVERAQARTAPTAEADDDASGGLVYTRNQLPEAIRNELPTLSIGGASYSKNPASRMLIINGQVFHEGDTLGPNLTLKQIQLKAAVLEYKGYRYKVSF